MDLFTFNIYLNVSWNKIEVILIDNLIILATTGNYWNMFTLLSLVFISLRLFDCKLIKFYFNFANPFQPIKY